MWTMEAWHSEARRWSKIGQTPDDFKAEAVVRLGAKKGFLTRATHPNGEEMTARPHGRGFSRYRPLEKKDDVPTDS